MLLLKSKASWDPILVLKTVWVSCMQWLLNQLVASIILHLFYSFHDSNLLMTRMTPVDDRWLKCQRGEGLLINMTTIGEGLVMTAVMTLK